MLVTLTPQGKPHSRPMATQDAEFDGSIWFLSDVDSQKIADIAAFPTVAVTYASSASESYLSLTGKAQVLNDRGRIKEFWNKFMDAWFDGPDDPRVRLIRVDVEQAEYWDTPGGKIASLHLHGEGGRHRQARQQQRYRHGPVQLGLPMPTPAPGESTPRLLFTGSWPVAAAFSLALLALALGAVVGYLNLQRLARDRCRHGAHPGCPGRAPVARRHRRQRRDRPARLSPHRRCRSTSSRMRSVRACQVDSSFGALRLAGRGQSRRSSERLCLARRRSVSAKLDELQDRRSRWCSGAIWRVRIGDRALGRRQAAHGGGARVPSPIHAGGGDRA